MIDNLLMENYLSVLKSNVEVYVHGTLESSFEDTQKLLHDSLNKTIESQRNTYKHLVDLGVYKVEKVEKNVINTSLKNLNK